MALFPALREQRQASLWVQGLPGLQTKQKEEEEEEKEEEEEEENALVVKSGHWLVLWRTWVQFPVLP